MWAVIVIIPDQCLSNYLIPNRTEADLITKLDEAVRAMQSCNSWFDYAPVICNQAPLPRGAAGNSGGNVWNFYICSVPAVLDECGGFVFQPKMRVWYPWF